MTPLLGETIMPHLIKPHLVAIICLLMFPFIYVQQAIGETGLNFVSAHVDGVEEVEGLTGASAIAIGGENGQHRGIFC